MVDKMSGIFPELSVQCVATACLSVYTINLQD